MTSLRRHPAATAPRVLADLVPGSLVRDATFVVGAALPTAAALGPARGALGQGLYVLGLAGLPFYSDGESGLAYFSGATGGYPIGFVVAAWIVGLAVGRGLDRSPGKALGVFAVGSVVIYAFGVPWLSVAADLSPGQAFAVGMLAFIPGATVEALLAAGLLPAAWRIVGGASPWSPR